MKTPTRIALALLLCIAGSAHADDKGSRVPLLARYVQECGTCHVAYPPALLPAASWQRLMGGLGKHYGSDAQLDPATVGELSRWLTANAGGKRARSEPPEDRITRSAWFVREHDEISLATWRLPSVRSAANCAACHTGAEQGSYREREIRVPTR